MKPEQPNIWRQRIAIAAACLLVLAFMVSVFRRTGDTSGDNSDGAIPGRATLINSDELVNKAGGGSYIFISRDLDYFARHTVAVYKNSPNLAITFKVTKASRGGQNIYYEGFFTEASHEKISGHAVGANYDRIHDSITNTKNNANIDSSLPSNTRDNAFIGSLPYTNGAFSISYNPTVEAFKVTVLTADPTAEQKATDYILSNSGLSTTTAKIVTIPYLD
jgi:hypothetical protein